MERQIFIHCAVERDQLLKQQIVRKHYEICQSKMDLYLCLITSNLKQCLSSGASGLWGTVSPLPNAIEILYNYTMIC